MIASPSFSSIHLKFWDCLNLRRCLNVIKPSIFGDGNCILFTVTHVDIISLIHKRFSQSRFYNTKCFATNGISFLTTWSIMLLRFTLNLLHCQCLATVSFKKGCLLNYYVFTKWWLFLSQQKKCYDNGTILKSGVNWKP